jgi:hypothetical protein
MTSTEKDLLDALQTTVDALVEYQLNDIDYLTVARVAGLVSESLLVINRAKEKEVEF